MFEIWKEHFQKLLEKSSIRKCKIMPVIEKDLDIVKGAFTVGKPKKALKNIKRSKAFGIDNTPGEILKIDDCNDFLLQLCNVVYFGSQSK